MHRQFSSTSWTRELLVDWGARYATKHDGTMPSARAYERAFDGPAQSTVTKYFGGNAHYYEAIAHYLATGEYPPPLLMSKEGRPKRLLFDEAAGVAAGVAYVRKYQRYPNPRHCTIAEGMPNESTIRRHFATFRAYHAAIYAHDPTLPQPGTPPPTQNAERVGETPAKLRRKCWGPEGLAGDSDSWQHGSDWLGGVDLVGALLDATPCTCAWCDAYANDPARRCQCRQGINTCLACRAYDSLDDEVTPPRRPSPAVLRALERWACGGAKDSVVSGPQGASLRLGPGMIPWVGLTEDPLPL